MVSRALAASVLLFSMDAAAATIQVGPTRALTEINQAVASLNAGDVVEVDGGAQYAPVLLTRSGSAAQPIRIVGLRAGGARPRIMGGASTIVVQADHVVIEGFDISGGSSSCFFHQGHDVTLRDSVVHDCPGQGILGADRGSGSFLLEYVEVHHTGAGASAHQIRVATDEVAHPGSVFRMQHCYLHDANGGNNVKSRAERNEIYYNWIEGAVYYELELIGPEPEEAAAGWSVDLVREDSDVVGNVLRKTSTSFVTRIGGDGTGWSKGRYRFVNNTIITMSSNAVWRLYDLLESVEMHNNVIVVNGTGGPAIVRAASGDFMWVNGTNIAGSNNWIASGATSVPSQWTGTITGTSPGLASLTADVRPVAGSPLVDAGSANLAGPTGFEFPNPLWPPAFQPPLQTLAAVGTAETRPPIGMIDIGAFELGGGGGAGGASGASGGGGTGGGGASGSGGGGTGGGGASGSGGGGTSGGGTSGSGGGGTSGGGTSGGGASGASGGMSGATGVGGTGAGGTGAGGVGGATSLGGAGGASGVGGAGGTAGVSGAAGTTGAAGAMGAAGASGAAGAAGATGAAGASGAAGATGGAGATGAAGSMGRGGSTGAAGSTGTAGGGGGGGGKTGTGGSHGTNPSSGCSCAVSNATSPAVVAPLFILAIGLCAVRPRRRRRR